MDDKLPYPNHRSIKVFEFKNSCADSPTAEDFFRYDRHTAVCEFENWEAVMEDVAANTADAAFEIGSDFSEAAEHFL